MDKNLTYKMCDYFSLQSWYTKDYFKLIKLEKDKFMRPFGYSCIWLNLNTGEEIERWDREFEPVSKEELRDYNLNKILNEETLEN